ncbi:MAG: 5'-nucleotidase C-terminal domain-containing protein [Myxococcaceae bacterium]|nr:5'-nucleotidase C-terminal domain-containing protein [Myxococcaceae bacterium]
MTAPTLGIIAINDVYALTHLPRVASLVAHHRARTRADRWLVVLAGDFVAPSVLSSLDGGHRMVGCLNALGVTHVILGNHEDDVPVSELQARVREFQGCWLGTNVHGFAPPLSRHDVVEVGGKRVGLVGVVMNDPNVYHRAPFGGVRLEDPNEVVVREAARLRSASGCDTVIALTHQWVKDDRALAQTGVVPLIIGGHEHDPHLEHVAGAVITKSGMDATHAAIVTLTLTEPPSVHVEHESTASYPLDPRLQQLVDEADAFIERLAGGVLVSRLPGPLSSQGSRVRQTTMGTFVTSTLRDALGVDGALFNGGGLRGSEAHTDVLTLGDLQNELPFDNEVVVAVMPGRLVREAVAYSRRHAPGTGHGGFLQVDDRARVGDDGHTLTHFAGAPLDDDRGYRVAVPRGHLLGLDRIEPFERFAREQPDAVPAAGSGRSPRLILLEALVRARLANAGSFEALDQDQDGRLTRAELTRALTEQGAPPSETTVSLVLDTLDANHDRVLTRDEVHADDEP